MQRSSVHVPEAHCDFSAPLVWWRYTHTYRWGYMCKVMTMRRLRHITAEDVAVRDDSLGLELHWWERGNFTLWCPLPPPHPPFLTRRQCSCSTSYLVYSTVQPETSKQCHVLHRRNVNTSCSVKILNVPIVRSPQQVGRCRSCRRRARCCRAHRDPSLDTVETCREIIRRKTVPSAPQPKTTQYHNFAHLISLTDTDSTIWTVVRWDVFLHLLFSSLHITTGNMFQCVNEVPVFELSMTS